MSTSYTLLSHSVFINTIIMSILTLTTHFTIYFIFITDICEIVAGECNFKMLHEFKKFIGVKLP
jgi:hypothetical protein